MHPWLLDMIVPGMVTCGSLLAAGMAWAQTGGGSVTSHLPGSLPIWTFQVPEGAGLAAPNPGMSRVAAQFGLVDGGMLYCASYNGHVYKLDLQTGKLLCDWNVSRGGCYSAPLKIDGKLYVYSKDKKLFRLETDPAPKAVLIADYSAQPGTVRVEALAYDPHAGLFFLGAGRKLFAVDRQGKERWSLPHANEQWTEPMACDGSLYVYDTADGAVYKYDPTGPKRLWKCPVGAKQGYLSKGKDGQGDELVFVAGWFGDKQNGTLTAIHDRGPRAGTPKWGPIPLDHPIKSVSLWEGHDGLLIPAMNGMMVWRKASTGQFIRQAKLSAAANSASPWAQMTISGKYGIVMSHDDAIRDNHLFVFDLETGREIWRSAPTNGSGGCMIPILSEGIAVMGTYCTGIWYAFRLGDGLPTAFSRFGNERNNGYIPGGLTALGGKLSQPGSPTSSHP